MNLISSAAASANLMPNLSRCMHKSKIVAQTTVQQLQEGSMHSDHVLEEGGMLPQTYASVVRLSAKTQNNAGQIEAATSRHKQPHINLPRKRLGVTVLLHGW